MNVGVFSFSHICFPKNNEKLRLFEAFVGERGKAAVNIFLFLFRPEGTPPHPLLFLYLTKTISHTSCPEIKHFGCLVPSIHTQTPRTGSAPSAMYPRCSRSPSTRGCRDRQSDGQCVYTLAGRCSGLLHIAQNCKFLTY